jgi:hypothetical protein
MLESCRFRNDIDVRDDRGVALREDDLAADDEDLTARERERLRICSPDADFSGGIGYRLGLA